MVERKKTGLAKARKKVRRPSEITHILIFMFVHSMPGSDGNIAPSNEFFRIMFALILLFTLKLIRVCKRRYNEEV